MCWLLRTLTHQPAGLIGSDKSQSGSSFVIISHPLPSQNNRMTIVTIITTSRHAGTPSHVCILAAIPFTRFKIWHYPPAHLPTRQTAALSRALPGYFCLD